MLGFRNPISSQIWIHAREHLTWIKCASFIYEISYAIHHHGAIVPSHLKKSSSITHRLKLYNLAWKNFMNLVSENQEQGQFSRQLQESCLKCLQLICLKRYVVSLGFWMGIWSLDKKVYSPFSGYRLHYIK